MKVQQHIFLHFVHVFLLPCICYNMMCWLHFSGTCVVTHPREMIYWLDQEEHKRNVLFSRTASSICLTTWIQCRWQSRVKVERGSLSSFYY